jgi:hypothetical protein
MFSDWPALLPAASPERLARASIVAYLAHVDQGY